MEKITLNRILKTGNRIQYEFSFTEGLAPYFSGEPFRIEYPESVESVPEGIAAVPFVGCVLPILWLTDSLLELPRLDAAFYRCIPQVRQGYETMFPETRFLGKLLPGELTDCGECPSPESAGMLFSGGLDSVSTLITHLEEAPALISIWGSDIRYDNAQGWERTHRAIAEYARRFDLPDVVIRSTFRMFDREGALEARFGPQLKDGWWHGMKHGIALLTHAAPYAWLHHMQVLYIASSHSPENGPVRCASNPLTDNHVRFGPTRVIHDGFEDNRQDKTRRLAEYVRKTGNRLPLHVCWESQSGGNCCRCEKCYRTMAGLIAEGEDPVDYGFADTRKGIRNMRNELLSGGLTPILARTGWICIRDRMAENREALLHSPYRKSVRWILGTEFENLDAVPRPAGLKIKMRLSRLPIYGFLRGIKQKIQS